MKLRMKQTRYQMTLYIYPVADCGKDLQTGDPLTVETEGDSVYELKKRITGLILYAMTTFKSSDGECFLEVSITREGNEYIDRDECWIEVDLSKNTVEYKGDIV